MLEDTALSESKGDARTHSVLLTVHLATAVNVSGAGAGQSVVQFAHDGDGKGQVALKFFLARAAYDAEADMRAVPPLAATLPPAEAMTANDGGAVRDGAGRPLPPLLALERGQSLDEWRRWEKPDIWASMRVRTPPPSASWPQ